MIITTHLLFGASIGNIIQNPFLAIFLAFLGHYLLDAIPHNEYSIKNIAQKNWRKSFPDFLKVFLDFLVGIFLIYILSEKTFIIFVSAFFGALPDTFSFLTLLIKNKFLEKHKIFHQEKIHFLKYKKISFFWRLLSQILIVVLSIFLLTY
jgi:hypothetical protein